MLSPFDRLVATEAAVRLEFVYRCRVVMLNHAQGTEEYSIANPDRGGQPPEVADHLCDAFVRIYDYAFADSSQHHKVVGDRACSTRDLTSESLVKLREIFQTFAEKNYDKRGHLTLPRERGPEALKGLFERIRDEVPLYHTSLACGALFTEMGRGEKWRKIFPRGVDFTRGEPVKENELSHFLDVRFDDAFFGTEHSPPSSRFINPPESKMEIAGLTFPVKTIRDWHTHLITQTGHLVDLTDDLRRRIEKHIFLGRPLDDLRIDVRQAQGLSDFVEGFAPIEEEQKLRSQVKDKIKNLSQSTLIDGLPTRDEQGHARLLCMDVDFLTGLSMKAMPGQDQSDLELLKAFLSQTLGITGFADFVPVGGLKPLELQAFVRQKMEKLRQAASTQGNEALEAIVAVATLHLEAMIPIVDQAANRQFVLKDGSHPAPADQSLKPAPVSEKYLYLTMGGAASGKSGLKHIADRECGQSLVVASLDDARGECDRYWLYPATNNHNDDYKSAEQFGNCVRDLITRRALQGGYDLYIDGSGIPYEGRNDKIVKLFKDKGYHTSVLAAQAPLYVHDPKRRKELHDQGSAPDDALSRLGSRQAKQLRGLNPQIVVDKHIRFPLASRNAARDPHVNRFMVEDVTTPQHRYTLSYVLTLDPNQTDKLAKLHGPQLKQALLENNLVPQWVTLPTNSDNEHLYNLKVIRANDGDQTYRVEIITDIEQYILMVEKGLLRRDAIGPEALYDNCVRADLAGYFHSPGGKLNTLGAKGVGERVVDQYLPFS